MQKILIIGTIIIFLAACGFKGPLYLPTKTNEPTVKSTNNKVDNVAESTINEK